MKRLIENWCRKVLYLQCFGLLQGFSRHKKRIIFCFMGSGLFKSFHINTKEHIAIIILTKYYGYKTYEQQLYFFGPKPPEKINHTWGEIQDIIRAYNTIRVKPVKPTGSLKTS